MISVDGSIESDAASAIRGATCRWSPVNDEEDD
jgi:hypothetical protein